MHSTRVKGTSSSVEVVHWLVVAIVTLVVFQAYPLRQPTRVGGLHLVARCIVVSSPHGVQCRGPMGDK